MEKNFEGMNINQGLMELLVKRFDDIAQCYDEKAATR